ncbi:transcription regulator HTH, apses-type DNA-binding domain-containing protein [Armillaria mellea]|nr:transcription regulator HTH, apses-type DNA-binding domain-containing protein [Armillaria mellea]
MQSGRQAPNQPPMEIYNVVYSSVQVYECMIRGIAVMQRRSDSFVNATQILKVAGVNKGQRTKILEKEILPGKHEIVQGGYGKYQGTWIPLERGWDIALQYVSTSDINSVSPRPLSASSSYSSIPSNTATNNYMAGMPSALAPPLIMPSSALRLLNQGHAQGLFTPSTSAVSASRPGYRSPNTFSQYPFSQMPPPSSQPLKRNRSEDAHNEASAPEPQAATEDGPSPTKCA